ncbi:MAG TPA: hypothetical protein VF478_05100 [Anaerolineae bacterium]
MPRVDYEKLSGERLGESPAKICERVQAARERQQARFGGASAPKSADSAGSNGGTPLQCDGAMGPGEVQQYCEIDDASKSLLRAAMPKVPRTE